MGLNLETIREWHDYFDSAGMDVFEVMENAIKVAIWYRPDEFLMRRDEIAQILFKKQSVQPYTGVINHRRDETQDRYTSFTVMAHLRIGLLFIL